MAERSVQAGLPSSQIVEDFAQDGDGEFGAGGRGRCAQVGDEVGDGDIGFVADRADDGDGAVGDGACDGFLVEGPEVFE